jgi:putative tryptophan/tyrosine transport system substrate-binding protein
MNIGRRRLVGFGIAATFSFPQGVAAGPTDGVRRIAVLMTTAENDPEAQARLQSLRKGLEQLGWEDGRNLKLEYRFASGDPERAKALAAELVRLEPDAILANGRGILAALWHETKTIPIVFVLVPDPVGDGFVASLARPGGNLTGITNFEYSMGGKWMQLLSEVAPSVRKISLLFNPETAPYARYFLDSINAGPRRFEAKVELAPVRNDAEIEAGLSALEESADGGLIVIPDLFTAGHRGAILANVERFRVPAIYPFRYFVTDGGLMSYGVDTFNLFQRSATYFDQIFRGASPADLPVQAPTKFEFLINMKKAKNLGLTVPPSVLVLANEVIE